LRLAKKTAKILSCGAGKFYRRGVFIANNLNKIFLNCFQLVIAITNHRAFCISKLPTVAKHLFRVKPITYQADRYFAGAVALFLDKFI
jgi:hypothetical protein